MNTMSRLETVQPEREQTPGSKNLGRLGKYALRSDPMEGISLPIRFAQPIVCWHSAALAADAAALQAPHRAGRYRVSGSGGANRIGRGISSCVFRTTDTRCSDN